MLPVGNMAEEPADVDNVQLTDNSTLDFVSQEGIKSLKQQEAAFAFVRGAATTLITVSIIVLAFLGMRARPEFSLNGWSISALFCFVCVCIIGLYILWPLPQLRFRVNLYELGELLKQNDSSTLPEYKKKVFYRMQLHFKKNEELIYYFTYAFRIQMIMLILEVLLWLGYMN